MKIGEGAGGRGGRVTSTGAFYCRDHIGLSSATFQSKTPGSGLPSGQSWQLEWATCSLCGNWYERKVSGVKLISARNCQYSPWI